MSRTARARQLRRDSTFVERLLWSRLRNRALDGLKFRRQQRIGPYVVDFACLERALIVELDGGQHALDVERDRRRTAFLDAEGYTVVRVWNHEVTGNLDGVVAALREVLADRAG